MPVGPSHHKSRPRTTNARIVGLMLALAGLPIVRAEDKVPTTAGGPVRCQGRFEQTFALPGDDAMHLPTDVAVDRQGRVYVADGAQDRIVVFDTTGQRVEVITAIGGQPFDQPMGLFVDERDQLWVADTGHGRVLMRKTDGSAGRSISLGNHGAQKPLDVTDVALTTDGRVLWAADNEGDRLIRIELARMRTRFIGRAGRSLGELQYPFMLALGADGDVFVTDVVNGRVAVFSDAGDPVRSISEYGVELGNVYRPKGVAVGPRGRVWISDGTLGVVQAFTATGRFIDVLRDEAGAIIRFDMPMGLAFDAQGRLYVVELTAHRVRRLAIAGTLTPDPFGRPRDSVTQQQPQACTACHLEWMEPLRSQRGTALIDVPPDTPELPLASTSEMCLSCHDGSIDDSRLRVWKEHGHRTGVTPSPGMAIPERYPLVDGKVMCRTCHSAHTTAPPEQTDMATAIFQRQPDPGRTLCTSCHQRQLAGPGNGAHPLGTLPWPIPEELASRMPAYHGDRQLTCEACHTAHGAHEERLMVLDPRDPTLCTSCHRKLPPGIGHPSDEGGHAHPLDVTLETASSRERIHQHGGMLGHEDELTCLSCHRMHDAKTERHLLLASQQDSQLCRVCHTKQDHVLSSAHDLRASHGDVRNALGQKVTEAGPCSACHAVHQTAREPHPHEVDPRGNCITCHREGQCADERTGLPMGHPAVLPAGRVPAENRLTLLAEGQGADATVRLMCQSCHRVHRGDRPAMLATESPHAICAGCHQQLDARVHGAHDFTDRPDLTNARGHTASEVGKCGFCHGVHGTEPPLMWAATDKTPARPDEQCTLCHSREGLAADHPAFPLVHPSGTSTAGKVKLPESHWPLYDHEGDETPAGGIACGTCHDIHAHSDRTVDLLRPAGHEGPTGFCLTCHEKQRTAEHSLHSHDRMHRYLTETGLAGDARFCAPCHVTHARSGQSTVGTWAAPMPTGDMPLDMKRCLGCHGEGGRAVSVHMTVHPPLPMRNITGPGEPGYMPLADDEGRMGPAGRVTCQTCHAPHGRDLPAFVDEQAPSASGAHPQLVRALAPMVRSFGTGNLCTSCHGFEGLSHFLYYHYPAKRQLMRR